MNIGDFQHAREKLEAALASRLPRIKDALVPCWAI